MYAFRPSISNDLDFDQESSSEPHLITQGELHDFLRHLELPNNKAELLGSRLQQCNLLAADVRVSKFRDCQQQFNTLFFMEADLVSGLQQYQWSDGRTQYRS